MDKIKIKVDGKNECDYKLPDISSSKFDDFIWKIGSNDIEYEKYKNENGMIELTDFNSQTTNEIVIVVENPLRGRVLKFKCIYDSDNDESFNEIEYFMKKHQTN